MEWRALSSSRIKYCDTTDFRSSRAGADSFCKTLEFNYVSGLYFSAVLKTPEGQVKSKDIET